MLVQLGQNNNSLVFCFFMKYLLMLLLGAIVPLTSFAAPLAPQNPYKNPTDDGNAKEITVVGSDKGQEDSFINVVK